MTAYQFTFVMIAVWGLIGAVIIVSTENDENLGCMFALVWAIVGGGGILAWLTFMVG